MGSSCHTRRYGAGMSPDQLAEIAAQLAARVREDDPEANARWLANVLSDPADWFRLAFVLAAAVPVEVPWTALTGWTEGRAEPPHGTSRAVSRHLAIRQPLCELCRMVERARKRTARQAGLLNARASTGTVDEQTEAA